MKVYYAHCLGLYNTAQEVRDIHLLTRLGFEVINPNTPETQEACDAIRTSTPLGCDPGAEVMEYFRKFARECDCLVFRALPDGSIPAGIAKEIDMFEREGKPIFELPSRILARTMTVGQTRQYLMECGYR
jgi:hypothetical protein